MIAVMMLLTIGSVTKYRKSHQSLWFAENTSVGKNFNGQSVKTTR
jgi:hypothetical protein